MTMIELLLALTMLVLLTGFLAGGLSLGRRAFEADGHAARAAGTDATVQVLAGLLASAIPVQANDPPGKVAFLGRSQGVSFVGLSEGHSLRGGLQNITLRRINNSVVAEFKRPMSIARKQELSSPVDVRLFDGVQSFDLRYFGKMTQDDEEPIWRAEWLNSVRLPNLMSVQITFTDDRRNEPPLVVALRQQ